MSNISLCLLFQDMGFAPNIYVYDNLVRQSQLDFGYLQGILEHMTWTGVAPDTPLLICIERKLTSAKKRLIQAVSALVYNTLLDVLLICMSALN